MHGRRKLSAARKVLVTLIIVLFIIFAELLFFYSPSDTFQKVVIDRMSVILLYLLIASNTFNLFTFWYN